MRFWLVGNIKYLQNLMLTITNKYKSICMQIEKHTLEPQQDSTILDEHKIPREGKILEGAHDVTVECDKCVTD